MKKSAPIYFLVIFLLIATVTAATERTTILGKIDPNSSIELHLTFKIDGSQITDQKSIKQADQTGFWQYTAITDPGTIELKAVYNGIEKEFSINSGEDFYVAMIDEPEQVAETEQTDTGVDEDLNSQVTGDAIREENATGDIEVEEVIQDTEQEKTTGFAISNLLTNSSKTALYTIGLIFAISIIIAFIVFSFVRKKDQIPLPSPPEEIRVTKLSDKVKELQEQKQEISKQEMPSAKDKFEQLQNQLEQAMRELEKLRQEKQ